MSYVLDEETCNEYVASPAIVSKPGEILEQELTVRGWTQKDLATILGRPISTINEIVRGVKQITPETALQLEEVLDIPAQDWLKLEANYRLWIARQQQAVEPDVKRRSNLYALAPIGEMIKRGWIYPSDSLSELEQQVYQFFQVKSLDELSYGHVCCRCSKPDKLEESALAVWVKRVEQLCRQKTIPPFNRDGLDTLTTQLLRCTKRAEDAALVPQILERVGIYFVVVGHLPKTSLDGAAFKVGENYVIALTLRYDRIDSFWFTLLHELGHILKQHDGIRVDDLEAKGEITREEEEADAFAKDKLIDAALYQSFVRKTFPYFSKLKIEQFAAVLNRHPGVLLGRLQKDGKVDYKNLRTLLASVKPYLTNWIDGSI